MSLIVFAVCLLAGLGAGNTMATTLSRALLGMAGTFAVGLAVGMMAQKMLDENINAMQTKQPGSTDAGQTPEKISGQKPAKPAPKDR